MTAPAASPTAHQRIVYKLLTDPVTPPTSLTWFLKMLYRNPLESLGFLRAHGTRLLAWPYNKSFSAPNSDVSVYLAPCVPGARTGACRGEIWPRDSQEPGCARRSAWEGRGFQPLWGTWQPTLEGGPIDKRVVGGQGWRGGGEELQAEGTTCKGTGQETTGRCWGITTVGETGKEGGGEGEAEKTEFP